MQYGAPQIFTMPGYDSKASMYPKRGVPVWGTAAQVVSR
jgi:hypothetical protein